MKNWPSAEFEKIIAESLKVEKLPELSTDEDFLRKLNFRLNNSEATKQSLFQIWLNGISEGLVAAAIGVILFIGLSQLPNLLVNMSVNGAGLVQEKIVQVTVEQQILWQQFVCNLKKI